MRLGIIEDSPTMRHLWEVLLVDSGHEHRCVDSRAGSVSTLDAFAPDLVVCPGFPRHLSPAELTSALAPLSARGPLLVATSREDAVVTAGWRLADVAGVLVKPFVRDRLLAQLAHAGAWHQARHRAKPLAVVIDDSRAASNVLAHLLEAQGFDVEAAATGAQGAELVEWRLPNLVLCDVALPDGSGLEVCAALSAHPATHDVPVVLISGAADATLPRRAREAGALDFLPKPVDDRRLTRAVRQHLRWGGFQARAGALLLEDERVSATLTRRMLSELGVVTHVCPTVADLELHLSVGTPSLLVLDRELPDGSGVEVCRRLRADPAWDRVPVVMISAGTDLAHRRECLRAGADDFLPKPFSREELRVRLAPLLRFDPDETD